MPLLEWGRDRDREAGAGPIPHLGGLAHHGLEAPVPRAKSGVKGEGDPVCHQFLSLAGLGVVPGKVAVQAGLFPTGRLSAVIQEGVWGEALMSSCSICDMGAVLTPPSHPRPWHSPGAQPACNEFVQPQPPGEEFGSAAAGTPWLEGAGGCGCSSATMATTVREGKLNSGSLKLCPCSHRVFSKSCHLPLLATGQHLHTWGTGRGTKHPRAPSGSPRRPGPCRACLQHARNIAGAVTGLKIASQQSATAFPKSHVVQVRGLIGNAYFDLQSDWIFPGHFERKKV